MLNVIIESKQFQTSLAFAFSAFFGLIRLIFITHDKIQLKVAKQWGKKASHGI